MNKKIFIIFHNIYTLNQILEKLQKIDIDYNICDKFTTDINMEDSSYACSYTYINQIEINKALKNNSLLYIVTNEYVSTGITSDDFENSNIFCLSYKEFNNISDLIFKKYDIMTIWIDSKKEINMIDTKYEIPLIEKRLESINYEYFLDTETQKIITYIEDFLT